MDNVLEGLSYKALQGQLAQAGVNPVHAKVLFRAVQRRLNGGKLELEEDISPPLRRWLLSASSAKHCCLNLVEEIASSDGCTRKYLLELDDGSKVEIVRMGFRGFHGGGRNRRQRFWRSMFI